MSRLSTPAVGCVVDQVLSTLIRLARSCFYLVQVYIYEFAIDIFSHDRSWSWEVNPSPSRRSTVGITVSETSMRETRQFYSMLLFCSRTLHIPLHFIFANKDYRMLGPRSLLSVLTDGLSPPISALITVKLTTGVNFEFCSQLRCHLFPVSPFFLCSTFLFYCTAQWCTVLYGTESNFSTPNFRCQRWSLTY